MQPLTIGIIGGSGFYAIEGFQLEEEKTLSTPFGDPSDPYVIGSLGGHRVAFLSRHGRGHRFSPSEVNYRANIYGFKTLGIKRVLSVSAVGSLKEELKPRDAVFIDQFFDRTFKRESSYFGEGIIAHASMAEPICSRLQETLYKAAQSLNLPSHKGGTYVNREGPHFSTKAESNFYRSCGFDVIGMTNATEAKVAREAGLCYATMALVTDYDCWKDEHVTVEMVVENLQSNIHNAQAILKKALPMVASLSEDGCRCAKAMENAIITSPNAIPEERAKKLSLLLGK